MQEADKIGLRDIKMKRDMSSVLIRYKIQQSKIDIHAFNNVRKHTADFAMSKQGFQETAQGDEFYLWTTEWLFVRGCLVGNSKII